MVTLEEMENFHQELVQNFEAKMDSQFNEIILEIRRQRDSRSHRSVSPPTSPKPEQYHRPHPQRADDFVDPHPATYFVDQTNGYAYVKPPIVTHPAYVNLYLPIKPAQLTTMNLSEHTAKATVSSVSTASTISETSETFTSAESTTTASSMESTTTVEEGPTIMAVKAPLICGENGCPTDLQTTVIPHACRTCSQTFQYSNQLHDHLRATSHFRGLPPKPLHSEKPTDTPHSTPYPTKPRTSVTTVGNTATPYAIRQPRTSSMCTATPRPHPTAIPHSRACRTCSETFLSNNSLHKHLRTSGHTTPSHRRPSRTNSHSNRTKRPSQPIPSRMDKPWRKQEGEGGTTMEKATRGVIDAGQLAWKQSHGLTLRDEGVAFAVFCGQLLWT
ncbi:MAG: hypothetical protein M1830_008897 [Pleopsidium flavum]|nr:MAG: hypothetical protein M1830_008897 [Pleopsidium flavum]